MLLLAMVCGVIAVLGCDMDVGDALAETTQQAADRKVRDTVSETLECDGCNVVLISIDTLRADHLGVYGYERDTSPNIDRFAEDSILFERAHSTANSTAESHMSMFTSLYPKVHRVFNTVGEVGNRLDDGIATLTEILAKSGFSTAGFHGGGNVEGAYGFDRGFETYTRGSVPDAVKWLKEHRDERFFLFFHTYHIHDPYTPSPPYDTLYDPDYSGDVISDPETIDGQVADGGFMKLREAFWGPVDEPADFEHVRALYDGEINEMDIFVGKLLATIQEVAGDDTVVILTADHGEEFQEHGRFRHTQLYQEIIHVPLIIRHPKAQGPVRIQTPVSLIDLAPTILDFLGVERPKAFQGRSLQPTMQGKGSPSPPFAEKVFGKVGADRPKHRRNNHMALIDGNRKLLLTDEPALFDLAEDPGETTDVLDQGDRQMRALMRQMKQMDVDNETIGDLLNSSDDNAVKLDEETLERLKALGYL